jgi:Cd2+/Zn2+-exporting ATPase
LPAFAGNEQHPSAFYNAMVLLVVGSPCALVLSVPSAILAAIASGARRGILFRGGAAVEKLATVDVVALDKTGTLTTGDLRVEKVESFPPGREGEVEAMAISIEKMSQHPLGRAIVARGKRSGAATLELTGFSSLPGSGLRAERLGKPVYLGKRAWIEQATGRGFDGAPVAPPGHSEVWIMSETLAGRILLCDDIRPEAKPVIEALRLAGIRSVVLTGDRPEAAALLKEALDPDEIRAGLRPEDKVAAIRELTKAGRRVAMVGDGVNDAPSLAAAYVGVAMGARGSDAALEQAEVVLMHDRLENFWEAYRLSQRARAVIHQNVIISLGAVGVLVAAAMLGSIPLAIGVVGHEGSTVVVVMNSLRLLMRRKE